MPYFIIGIFIGSWIGFFVCCLMVIAKGRAENRSLKES